MAHTVSIRKAIHEWRLYFFVLPVFILLGTFHYYPSLSGIYHSFFDWSGGDVEEYIGLRNFQRILSYNFKNHTWVYDLNFWISFKTVLILTVFNIVKMLPSIAIAVLIHRVSSQRWQYWYRVMLVVPMVVPGLVTLFVWQNLYLDPNWGIVNKVFNVLGIKSMLVGLDRFFGWNIFQPGMPIAWLSQPELIIPSLILWGFPWIGSVGVLIFLAGLQSIGTDVYEAAELDGANGWQKFMNIEFPLIMTQIRLSLILVTIGTLRDFGLQFLLLGENGGPGGKGMVPGLWMFNQGFVAGRFGYACALGLVILAFILVLTYINNKFVRVDK